MSLHLSKDAEQDIADIYVYSFEQFGEAKAESYYQALVEHFDSLERNPAMGRDFSFVKGNVRRTNCVSHAVYYRVTGRDVLVLRVLHQNRDPARHL